TFRSSSKQSIGEYENKPVVSVTARQINMFSAARGLAPMTMLRPVAENLGIQDSRAGEGDLVDVARMTTELSERDNRVVMSLVDAMRTDESGQHDTGNLPEPTPLHTVDRDEHTEDASAEQKTPSPDLEDLAAHPDIRLAADSDEEYFDHLGEENQDGQDSDVQ